MSGRGTSGNVVAGNYVGTDATGGTQLANGLSGVEIDGDVGNTVGGAAAPAQQPLLSSAGLVNPLYLVRTSSGALYFDDQSTNTIYQFNPISGALTVFSSGGLLTAAEALAYDPVNNALVVSNYNNATNSGNLIRINLATATQTSLTSGQFLKDPDGIAVAPNGTYYVSSYDYTTQSNRVIQVNPTNGAQTLLGGSFPGNVNDIAVSSSGQIYVTDAISSSPSFVSEILGVNPTTGATTVISSGGALVYAGGLSVLPDGSIVTAVQVPPTGSGPSPSQIVKVNPYTGSQTILSSGGNLIDTVDVVAEPSGDLLAVNGLFHPTPYAVVRVQVNPARNVLSGNLGYGVLLQASGDVVAGNFIGVSAAGTSALGDGIDGLLILGASNTVGGTAPAAGNVISANGQYNLDLQSGGNLVQGNIVGTDATGTLGLGRLGGNGITGSVGILVESANNTIGGSVAGDSNLISGNFSLVGSNSSGVLLTGTAATGNMVAGNLIGTDITSTKAIGQNFGIAVQLGASNNLIGTNGDGVADALERNIISGNQSSDLIFASVGTNQNVVAGNYIGTDVTGSQNLGAPYPSPYIGVTVEEGAANNRIGANPADADSAGERNVISGHYYDGVLITDAGTTGNVVSGNYIGTNAAGSAALPNARQWRPAPIRRVRQHRRRHVSGGAQRHLGQCQCWHLTFSAPRAT